VKCCLIVTAICCGVLNGYCRADVPAPVVHWNFDHPEQDKASDEFQGALDYVPGAAGKALVFDGYSTEVARSSEEIETLGNAFTISAWIAPQEYSWNVSAIVNQMKGYFKEGYLFGIDHRGRLVGAVSSGPKNRWRECISNESLPLLKWSHVSMTYKADRGIQLFINGEKAGELEFTGKPVYANESELCIGKTQAKMTPANTERAGSRAVDSLMYFDGLIDELHIYGSALADDEIRKRFGNTKVSQQQPLQFRQMPSGTDQPRPFGAYYTTLKYSPGWDAKWQGSALPDVVVRFDDSPVKLVFWRGTGYIPAMVTENGIWMADQSGENFGRGECYEAMGDKQCRYSRVRIIENSPARAVIHWRYALSSITHRIMNETETSSGDWMDEYWTAYPDGVVVRKQVLWAEFEKPQHYQFQETIFFNQPGTKPQDNVEFEAITFMNMNGNKESYSWKERAPKSFPRPQYKPVEMINTKSEYRPYRIFHPERVTRPFRFGWIEGYSTFPCWNHWPVQQIPSDGRKAVAPDKPSHSSLTAVNGHQEKVEKFPDGSVRTRAIWGMTTGPIDSLLPLARSWNEPPQAESVTAGFEYKGYDPYQRAYVFESQGDTDGPLAFELAASKESPVVNVPVVIKKWGPSPALIRVNGKTMASDQGCTQGLVRTLETDDRVIWIPLKSTSAVKVEIQAM